MNETSKLLAAGHDVQNEVHAETKKPRQSTKLRKRTSILIKYQERALHERVKNVLYIEYYTVPALLTPANES